MMIKLQWSKKEPKPFSGPLSSVGKVLLGKAVPTSTQHMPLEGWLRLLVQVARKTEVRQ
jgi:hypothetical protein